MQVQSLTFSAVSDMIESSIVKSQTDLGPVLLVECFSEVTGDFIAITTTEGTCAVITA